MITISPPKIETYEFGRIEINGQSHTSDVIVLPTGVLPNWWREQGHLLQTADLDLVFESTPQLLVVGQGAHGCMKVSEDVMVSLGAAGIDFLCAPTGEAVKIYNQLSHTKPNVAAALHLTC